MRRRSHSTVRGRLAAIFVLAPLVAATTVAARPGRSEAPRLEVVGHVNPGGTYAADVWAHRGHAYLSSYRSRRTCPAKGVRVIDLQVPRRPRLVARFGAVAGTWTEKTVVKAVSTPGFRGDLAVTSFQSCDSTAFRGFGLYDMTDPRRPTQLALVPTEPRGSHEIWLGTAGGRAYVYTAIIRSEILSSPDYDDLRRTATEPGEPDFRIYDVSDPRRPEKVGEWGAWRTLGVHPNDGLGDGRLGANFVHSVMTNEAGTRAFLSYWDLGTVILDISSPGQPRYLGRTRFARAQAGNAHSAALGRGETLLAETHETGGGTPTLWDVSSPDGPRRLGEVKLPPQLLRQGRHGEEVERVSGLDLSDSVHDAELAGRYAYFSWYRQGVVLADVSDPRRPRVVARFLPTPARDPDEVFCPGRSCRAVWGVALSGPYVVASDLLSGLWVLRVRGG
jgi:hypothetical protein